MILKYHKGQNFGDALNPKIFNHYLPGFFNGSTDEIFYGIGSILGFVDPDEKKKIIFSSGYAAGSPSTYGRVPSLDSSYDVVCVRGPLTAKALNIEEKLAICDGAILLKGIAKPSTQKHFEFSFMPHVGSLDFFSDWDELLASLGIHFINPMDDPDKIIQEIQSTGYLITEAMHGAIVADTLRTPWIAVKQYKTINDFKWHDFALSLNLDLKIKNIASIYSEGSLKYIINSKFKKFPQQINNIIVNSYLYKQNIWDRKKLINQLKEIKSKNQFLLSSDDVLNQRFEQLLTKIDYVKNTYSKNY